MNGLLIGTIIVIIAKWGMSATLWVLEMGITAFCEGLVGTALQRS
mgnify:CR=1 FL=1